MKTPHIISNPISRELFLYLLEDKDANLIAPLRFWINPELSKFQTINHPFFYQKTALWYCIETFGIKGIGKYSLRNKGVYQVLIRFDEIYRKATKEELNINKFKNQPIFINNKVDNILITQKGEKHNHLSGKEIHNYNKIESFLFTCSVRSTRHPMIRCEECELIEKIASPIINGIILTENFSYLSSSFLLLKAENGVLSITDFIDFSSEEGGGYSFYELGCVLEMNGETYLSDKNEILKISELSHLFNPWN